MLFSQKLALVFAKAINAAEDLSPAVFSVPDQNLSGVPVTGNSVEDERMLIDGDQRGSQYDIRDVVFLDEDLEALRKAVLGEASLNEVLDNIGDPQIRHIVEDGWGSTQHAETVTKVYLTGRRAPLLVAVDPGEVSTCIERARHAGNVFTDQWFPLINADGVLSGDSTQIAVDHVVTLATDINASDD